MSLLDRLRPRWRHSDPSVRADSVRALGQDAQDLLAAVAQQDEDAAVRRIAVAKLDDPSLLATIARTDSDPGLRELAAARTAGLLAEIVISDRDVGECLRALDTITEVRHLVTIATSASQSGLRRAALAKVSDEKALARIARNATDAALGLDALRRVVSPPLLRRIAGSSAPSEVALAALERLNDPETLRAITEERTAQRSVRRRARAKLADVLDDQQPLRVAKVRRRQVELCVAVERPEDPHDPERMDERLARAEKEWLELAALAVPEPELESRFQRARAHLVERMASVQARESQRERREEERRQGDEARGAALCVRRVARRRGNPPAPRASPSGVGEPEGGRSRSHHPFHPGRRTLRAALRAMAGPRRLPLACGGGGRGGRGADPSRATRRCPAGAPGIAEALGRARVLCGGAEVDGRGEGSG